MEGYIVFSTRGCSTWLNTHITPKLMSEMISKSLNCSAGKNKPCRPLTAPQPSALSHLSDNSRNVRKNICHSPWWHLTLDNPLETQSLAASALPPCSAINSPLAWRPQWRWSHFSFQSFYTHPPSSCSPCNWIHYCFKEWGPCAWEGWGIITSPSICLE